MDKNPFKVAHGVSYHHSWTPPFAHQVGRDANFHILPALESLRLLSLQPSSVCTSTANHISLPTLNIPSHPPPSSVATTTPSPSYLLQPHPSLLWPTMSYTTSTLLCKPKALLCYGSMIPQFTITKPVQKAFTSSFIETTSTFHTTHPQGPIISVTLQLPNYSYDCEYYIFQYIQLWQELQSATAHHDPPFPDKVLCNLWAQMLGIFPSNPTSKQPLRFPKQACPTILLPTSPSRT